MLPNRNFAISISLMQSILLSLVALLAFSHSAQADIVRFMQVDNGVYRGGQPEAETDYDLLQFLGVKTIVSFRTGGSVKKERAIAESRGMTFIHAPISSIKTVLLPPKKAVVARALSALTDPSLKPVFFHCHKGKDRTGYIAALYRVFVQDWVPRRAADEMYRMGFAPFFKGLENDFWYRTSGHGRPGDLELEYNLAQQAMETASP